MATARTTTTTTVRRAMWRSRSATLAGGGPAVPARDFRHGQALRHDGPPRNAEGAGDARIRCSFSAATTISTAIAGSRRGGPEGSAWADLLGHALQAAPVVLPPRLVPGRHVVVAIPQPDGPVDEFPDDIGVPRVPVSLGDHVDQDPVQRHLA